MKAESFRDFVLDQLAEISEVACRGMFGGHGIYCGREIFGILFQGRLYFKTTPATRADYTRRRMKSFRPNARQTLKSYYEVPAEILESRAELAAWARRALGS